MREDLLSKDRVLRLRDLEKDLFDLPTIVEVIKEKKIGQEIKFLPRRIENLKAKLARLISNLMETTDLSCVRKRLVLCAQQTCLV